MHVYRSTDAGAPVQTGQTRSLIDVWNAILVTGYGTTVAAGWSKPYDDGVDEACFRQGSSGSANRSYLRVLENSHAFNADSCRLTGYETMSAVATGTNPFPNSVDNCQFWTAHQTGITSNPGAVPWLCLADARTFMYFNRPHLDTGQTHRWNGMLFGDFFPYDPAEQYHQCVIAGPPGNELILSVSRVINSVTPGMNAAASGAYALCRTYAGGTSVSTGEPVGSTTEVVWSGDAAKMSDASGDTIPLGNGLLPRPNPADGRTYFAPLIWTEATTGQTRGFLRGFWQWCHDYASLTDQETITGSDDVSGREFLVLKEFGDNNGNAVDAAVVLEISDTWDTV